MTQPIERSLAGADCLCLKDGGASNSQGHFLGAKLERMPAAEYDILWFVWDRDGPIRIEDWEPLILIWKGTKLVRVTTRPHYQWKDYFAEGFGEPVFTFPLKIAFIDTFHPPILETKESTREFRRALEGLEKLYFAHDLIQTGNVPSTARKARLKIDRWLVTRGQDIHDKAAQCLSEMADSLSA